MTIFRTNKLKVVGNMITTFWNVKESTILSLQPSSFLYDFQDCSASKLNQTDTLKRGPFYILENCTVGKKLDSSL